MSSYFIGSWYYLFIYLYIYPHVSPFESWSIFQSGRTMGFAWIQHLYSRNNWREMGFVVIAVLCCFSHPFMFYISIKTCMFGCSECSLHPANYSHFHPLGRRSSAFPLAFLSSKSIKIYINSSEKIRE